MKRKTNELTLKQLYEISYGVSEPFVEWKNPGYFVSTNMLAYLVRKKIEDNNQIGVIDIFSYMLYEKGLDLDDLEYCFESLMQKSDTQSFDNTLYKVCSNDKMFDKTRLALQKLPDYLIKKIGLDKNDYNSGEPVTHLSYNTQDVLFSFVSKERYANVFKRQYNLKEYNDDMSHRLIVKDFFDELFDCYKNKKSIKAFCDRWIMRFDLTISKIKQVRNEFVESSIPDIVYQIQDLLTSKNQEAVDIVNDEQLFKPEKIANLDKMVVGQEKAMGKIKNRLLAANVGFKQEGQPIASFLLTGPTGVGKTETAKAVADACFDGKIYVVDMSTFKNSIDVSRLTGGSPNYVGYNDKNNFCEFVKENPNSVILFDELEKAHPDCTDVVMRILDEGQFINAKGETYNFENTVIICTTNLTQNKKTTRLGFATSQEETTEELVTGDTGFKKEIIGRFSDVIEYERLQKEACTEIAKKFINACIKNFEKYNKRNIKLKYSEELVEQITYKANTQLLGARDLKKTIQSEFINVVSTYISQNDSKDVILTVTPNGIKKHSKPVKKAQPKQQIKKTTKQEEAACVR